jgi:chitinase
MAFAQTVWDVFLGGNSPVRPFPGATLDGVDLDIEGGATTGYAAYVTRLRALMNGAAPRHYYITAAPQCPYPDAYLGPGKGLAFGDALPSFDFLSIQFYNNFCSYHDPNAFLAAWQQWAALARKGGPRILVGLPATQQAAQAAGYVDRATAPSLLKAVAGDPAFGGFMLWDASFDQNSAVNGQTYGAFLAALP